MLSYQHGFHAGNFADVHKHWVVSRLLVHLCAKPRGWTWYETHAGRGHYDLTSEQARKTGEWRHGIGRLWTERDQAPEVFQVYFEALEKLNTTGKLEAYAGSPLLAAMQSHPGRELVLCELHPQEFTRLRHAMKPFGHCHLHHRDGFEGVAALVPPHSGRGAILVDPSYEHKDDFTRIPRWVDAVLGRWRQAMIAIWYPVLERPHHRDLLMGLKAQGVRNVWRSELMRPAEEDPSQRMRGSGMVVINPPWKLAADIESGWDWLARRLGADAAQSTASDMWIPE